MPINQGIDMNRSLSYLTLSLFSVGAIAVPIEWINGKTKVVNGDIVIYNEQCYIAQNNPGSWETPSPSSNWFWQPTECNGTPIPTCNDNQELIDGICVDIVEPVVCPNGQILVDNICVDETAPPVSDITLWIAGEIKVNNGDIVSYKSQCFEAKNSPGVWETPKSSSWFWNETSCPDTPLEPIECPDGSTAPTIKECPTEPPKEVTCPDGTITESYDNCPATQAIFVSPDGNDNNNGSFTKPYKTLKKALSQAKAGSIIELAEGRYKTAEVIDKANGISEAPIVIRGNNSVFDGTIDITTPWQQHDGNIYKTQINQDIWQLFIDDKMVMSARWPNAQLSDGSLWDMKSTWRHQAPESRFGEMIDERPYEKITVKSSGNEYQPLPAGVNTQSLADSGIDATGAIAIMNIGSWLNWAQVIDSHTVGSNRFTYSTDFSKSGTAMKKAASNMLSKGNFWANKNGKYEEGHYYLEGKLELLDSPNEWFFDKQTKTVYLWAPNDADPNQLHIRGKHQTYGLTIRNSSHLIFDNVDFFATAFTVISSQSITFNDLDAQYYAYSKRMLGDLTRPQTIKFINNNKAITETQNKITNSYLAYTDGPAFEMIKENSNVIDNNLIHDIDYSNLGTGGEGSINMASQSQNITFSNNTFHTAGNSEGVRVGARSKVIGNHVYNTSLLQHDGAAINVGIDEQAGTEIAYNWVHDTPKAGIRFDGVEGAAKTGKDGLVHHNVVWNSAFNIIKGDTQGTYNNLMFNNIITDLIIFNKASAGGLNYSSETLNNLVGTLQGRKSGTSEQLAVPGIVANNITGNTSEILSHLKGAYWGDFRPKDNAVIIDMGTSNSSLMTIEHLGSSPDIGAYEYGDHNSWIPGHSHSIASNPVPFNNATNVDLNIELMFSQDLNRFSYDVYLGKNIDALLPVDKIDNKYSLNDLSPNTQYYWRVDVIENNKVTTGDIWSFSTK